MFGDQVSLEHREVGKVAEHSLLEDLDFELLGELDVQPVEARLIPKSASSEEDQLAKVVNVSQVCG